MHQEDNQIPSSGPELEPFQNDLLITFNPGRLHLPQEGFNIFSAQAYRANSEVQQGTPERQKSPSRNTSSSRKLPSGEAIVTSSKKIEEPKKLSERTKPRNVSCQKRLFGVAERFDWEDYHNDPEYKQRAQMLKNHLSLFEQEEQEDHRKTFVSSAFLLTDHEPINIIVPDVLPPIHSQISGICGPEEYLKFHPWSITNLSKKSQPQSKERTLFNQMLDIYFKVSNATNQLMEMGSGQNDDQLDDRFYYKTLEGSLKMFNDSNRRTSFQNLQNMSPSTRFLQNYSADQTNLGHIAKIQQNSRQKSSEQENEYKSASRTVFVEVFEQKKTQNSKSIQEKNQRQKNKPSKSQLKTSINSNISPTLPLSFNGNRSGSTNDNSTSKKNSSDTNSTNVTKKNNALVPQVSEFKISEFDKPFTMKYTISLDSYEESSWKWFLYRMKNGINRKYNGSVYFEKFSSWCIAERVILEDFLYRNEKVRRLCNQSRKTDKNVFFETLFDSKTGDTDMKALVVLPLQLKLPEGYSYSYQSYRHGNVSKLSIENEHASIRYFGLIKLGRKDEGRRDLRKKLKLERDIVWVGDEILRQQAIVTFKNPSSRKVSIESNHSEHIYYRESITTKNDIGRMQTCYSTVQTEEGPLMKTICWKIDPKYKKISLRFKLKVLAFYAVCFLIANFINVYFAASEV